MSEKYDFLAKKSGDARSEIQRGIEDYDESNRFNVEREGDMTRFEFFHRTLWIKDKIGEKMPRLFEDDDGMRDEDMYEVGFITSDFNELTGVDEIDRDIATPQHITCVPEVIAFQEYDEGVAGLYDEEIFLGAFVSNRVSIMLLADKERRAKQYDQMKLPLAVRSAIEKSIESAEK